MWKVTWYNYYWEVETLTITDEEYQACLAIDANYYISAVRLS